MTPARLELNNSGSWKVLGRFDFDDEAHTALVLEAAEALLMNLHNSEDPKHCPTLRVSAADCSARVLARWSLTEGWRDVLTGEAI